MLHLHCVTIICLCCPQRKQLLPYIEEFWNDWRTSRQRRPCAVYRCCGDVFWHQPSSRVAEHWHQSRHARPTTPRQCYFVTVVAWLCVRASCLFSAALFRGHATTPTHRVFSGLSVARVRRTGRKRCISAIPSLSVGGRSVCCARDMHARARTRTRCGRSRYMYGQVTVNYILRCSVKDASKRFILHPLAV